MGIIGVLSACASDPVLPPQRPAMQYSAEYYCMMGYLEYCDLVEGGDTLKWRALADSEAIRINNWISNLSTTGTCGTLRTYLLGYRVGTFAYASPENTATLYGHRDDNRILIADSAMTDPFVLFHEGAHGAFNLHTQPGMSPAQRDSVENSASNIAVTCWTGGGTW